MTQKEKILLIKKMIKKIQGEEASGFCGSFQLASKRYDIKGYDIKKEMLKTLPELKKYEPKYKCVWWFPPFDSKTRINILKEILNKLKNANS
ncbi:MAG TPA: hypothetical protein VL443_30015 [Cyclobacteriaceae bacterium]|jgi:hypothetical protein|nr:hypothetical protein [Cyclobacteriaceae bacterium]